MPAQDTLEHVAQVLTLWPHLKAFKLIGNNTGVREVKVVNVASNDVLPKRLSDCPPTLELAKELASYVRSNPQLRLLELSGTREPLLPQLAASCVLVRVASPNSNGNGWLMGCGWWQATLGRPAPLVTLHCGSWHRWCLGCSNSQAWLLLVWDKHLYSTTRVVRAQCFCQLRCTMSQCVACR